MAVSPVNYSPERGLTLIEVLIALAIVSIAMTAIIKATAQSIRATTHLQNKTMALWVGQQVINAARVGVLVLPNAPDKLKQTTTLLNTDWYWQADQQATPNNHIKKLVVDVFASKNMESTPIITLESYVYRAE